MRKVSLSQKAMENQTELVCQQQGKGYDNVFEDSFQGPADAGPSEDCTNYGVTCGLDCVQCWERTDMRRQGRSFAAKGEQRFWREPGIGGG